MMKNYIALFIFFISFSTAFSQKLLGMVQLKEGVWIDDTEITNNEYRQFLNAISSEERRVHYPDTALWAKDVPKGEVLVGYYFTHPAYDDYPVVGISHESAIAFCVWRTDFYNKNNEMLLTFRLPSEKEWLEAAELDSELSGSYAGGYSDPNAPTTKSEKKFLGKKRNKGTSLFNYGPISEDVNGGYIFSNPVRSNYPSSGIYGLSGNVAEMTSEKGISKGGSFFQDLNACKKEHITEYSKPEVWLGFRCIAVKE